LRQWLAAREQSWRDKVQVVARDGFTGFKTAATDELPDAVAVMNPFHVERLAGDLPRISADVGIRNDTHGTAAARSSRRPQLHHQL
jgi:transposase